jgi:hypothetical protein
VIPFLGLDSEFGTRSRLRRLFAAATWSLLHGVGMPRIYRERMPDTSLEAPIEGPRVDELKGWSSLWGDLLLVEMTLHSRSQTDDIAANLFARRALWEAAVTAYWRTANTGRRQQQITELLAELGDGPRDCHKEIELWRNQHVAHRVDDLRERVDVRLSLNENGAPKKTIVRVAPVLGPEEEGSDLAERAMSHVRALKDRVWETRIQPLEAEIVRSHDQSADELLEAARSAPKFASHFAITINP